jgi:hypothetical protein
MNSDFLTLSKQIYETYVENEYEQIVIEMS